MNPLRCTRRALPIIALCAAGCGMHLQSTGSAASSVEPKTRTIDTVQTLYPTNELMERFECYRRPSGERVKHGFYLMWNQQGIKVQEGRYADGKREGLFRSYFADGKPEMEATYHNDVEDGQMTWWYESGSEQSVETYKNGVKEGPYRLYYDNNKLKYEGTFVNGAQHGTFVRYFPNGDPQAQGQYDNGKLLFETTDFKK